MFTSPFLICPIDALDRVVADEGLLHEDQLPFDSAVPGQAGHALLPGGVSTLTLLLVGRLDLIAPIVALIELIELFLPALAGPISSAPVPTDPITGPPFPEGLVSTDDCIR